MPATPEQIAAVTAHHEAVFEAMENDTMDGLLWTMENPIAKASFEAQAAYGVSTKPSGRKPTAEDVEAAYEHADSMEAEALADTLVAMEAGEEVCYDTL